MTDAPQDDAPVLLDHDGDIAIITLNRPHAGNAIDRSVVEGLISAAGKLAEDRGAQAIILTGKGKLFCGGGDLQGFRKASEQGLETLAGHVGQLADGLHTALLALLALRIPVIAALNGSAGGAGMSLVAAADLAFARPHVKFASAYGELGLAADGGMSWFLPRKVGHARAVEILLGSRRLTASEAQEFGLIHAVIDDGEEDFLQAVIERTRKLCRGTPASRAATLDLLRSAPTRDLGAQLRAEAQAMAALAGSEAVRQRLAALD